MDENLREVAKTFAKALVEYNLRKTLSSVAGELPPEVQDEIYIRMYRPVMLEVMKSLVRVVKVGGAG
jgi:hypothetical protein